MQIGIESRVGLTNFTCEGEERILFAGLRAGLTLPYDCATGTCGMCKARVRSGTVETIWPEAPAFAKLQRDKGDILMCQTRATSDCVLRVPANVVAAAALPPHHRTGVVRHVEKLTHDVMHFEIALPAPMSFDAGQFVVMNVGGLAGGRSYSMVNHEGSVETLELVLKRKPGGAVSDWLFSADRTGQEAKIFGPLGRATLRPHEDRDLVCIAGGSGIAGIVSILEHATACGHFERHKGQVYFGVRTLADGFYLDRLSRHVEAAKGALRVVLALSHETVNAPSHPKFPHIGVATGFVHDVAGSLLDADCAGTAAFVAGPPPMVDGAIRVLLGHNVASTSIRYDKFG